MQGKLIVEDVQELPLYPAHVALSKYTGAQRPVDVLQRRVIAILGSIALSASLLYPMRERG